MTGFPERFSSIKAKQEEIDAKKREVEAAAAAETAREREVARNELSSRREELHQEFTQAEQTAREANEVVAEADAFAAEQGENLDPGVAAEISDLKAGAAEAGQRFEELRAQLGDLTAEIESFEAPESVVADAETAEVEEAGLEQEEKIQQTNEEELAGLQEAVNAAEAEIANAEKTISFANYRLERYEDLLASPEEDLEGKVRLREDNYGLYLFDVAKTNEYRSELTERKEKYDAVSDKFEARIREFRAINLNDPRTIRRTWGSVEKKDTFQEFDPELHRMLEQMEEIGPASEFGKYANFDPNNYYAKSVRHGETGDLIDEMPQFEGEVTRREAYEKISEYLRDKKEEAVAQLGQSQETIEQLRSQIEKSSSEPLAS